MLHSMQLPAQSAASPASPSFAGLLAALASPRPEFETPTAASSSRKDASLPAWNDDALADDISTLSYERALRTHARYKSSAPGDWSLTQQFAAPEPIPAEETNAEPLDQTATPQTSARSEDAEPESPNSLPSTLDENRKCASVTIRMSKAECEQLHRRAAEAGLTVSAYLRSCTFEAETLRAQVKETLAQLRKSGAAEKQAAPSTSHRSLFGWLLRLLPRVQTSQRMARA
jgi:predicted DNA binding CopG/RHH family protein